jgi:hypothetical protein
MMGRQIDRLDLQQCLLNASAASEQRFGGAASD